MHCKYLCVTFHFSLCTVRMDSNPVESYYRFYTVIYREGHIILLHLCILYYCTTVLYLVHIVLLLAQLRRMHNLWAPMKMDYVNVPYWQPISCVLVATLKLLYNVKICYRLHLLFGLTPGRTSSATSHQTLPTANRRQLWNLVKSQNVHIYPFWYLTKSKFITYVIWLSPSL